MAKKTFAILAKKNSERGWQWEHVRAKNIVAAILKLVVQKGFNVDRIRQVELDEED